MHLSSDRGFVRPGGLCPWKNLSRIAYAIRITNTGEYEDAQDHVFIFIIKRRFS